MVCSYCYFCLELPVVIIYCQVGGLTLRLNHFYQGGYVLLNDIDFDGTERKICRNCFDNLRDQGKPETLKKAEYNTVYGADESEEG